MITCFANLVCSQAFAAPCFSYYILSGKYILGAAKPWNEASYHTQMLKNNHMTTFGHVLAIVFYFCLLAPSQHLVKYTDSEIVESYVRTL